MPVPLETFVKQLEDSGIVAPGKLENFIPPKATPKDAQELLRELVKSQNLTKYQAQEIYQGRVKSLILGNYTILDKIGAGGMGQVFKAKHRRMDRIVAIKMLPPAVTKDQAAVARFEREVRAAARLRHTNIVAADDADEANGVHFLVMEYVEGSDLSALVKKTGPLPVEKAVNCILQAARGLEYAHKNGVIHRDIKPANLLLNSEGTVKILDMGLARLEQGDGEAQAELTGTGAVMGTVDYMAPEQALSTHDADARADIYSLGCSLYYLVAGKATYGGDSLMAKLLAHRESPIPSLRAVQPDVPEQVEAVFRKMVAKKIEHRYQSMSETVADLERCGIGRDVSFGSQLSLGRDADEGLLTFLRDIPAATTHKPKATKPAKSAGEGGSKSNKRLLIGAGVLGFVFLLGGVIFMLRTKAGTLVVEVNQPDAMVQVLDGEGKVEISQPGGKEAISIYVVPGKHRIRVEKDGFAVIAQDFEIESGGKLDIKARLVPKAKQVAGQPNKPWNTHAFQAWMKSVTALTAEKQVEAVAKKLVELNPGFDGKVTGGDGIATPKIVDGVVTEFRFHSESVADISPVRALVGLRLLSCPGNGDGKAKLTDLTPLEGLPLTALLFHSTQVSDLSPLAEMPLVFVNCGITRVSDLSPLKGMSLTTLYCHYTQVSDLSPLTGMPLKELYCYSTPVSDLSPLEDCKDLKSLRARETKLTSAGVATLQKCLPNCKIEWDGTVKPITTFHDPAFQSWMKTVAALPAAKQLEAVSKKLMELNPGFDGKVAGHDGLGPPIIVNDVVTEFGFFTDNVTDISPVRAFVGLKALYCIGSGPGKGELFDLSPLQGLLITKLDCHQSQVSDLSSLRGMPFTYLHLGATLVSDLSPLEAMRLTYLNCNSCTRIVDLSPLAGMPLTALDVGGAKVSDVSPLQGMPLEHLRLSGTQVSELSSLEDCRSLKRLVLQTTKVTAAGIAALQKALPDCKIEWDSSAKPTTTFNDPAFQAWMKDVAALPAEKQLEAVSKKLMELNPGFDGVVTPKIVNGVVTEIGFKTEKIIDISPVRALAELKSLGCSGVSNSGVGKISDLSPLEGLKLTHLNCGTTMVADLSPLKGMGLIILYCDHTEVSDLSPLKGMPLSGLWFDKTAVLDLSTLRGMPLKNISCDFKPYRETEALRSIKTLQTINSTPAAEFWKKYDAGKFGKPAAPAKLAYLDPAFQQWVADTQKLPAEQQIEAVSKKLMELNPGFDGKLANADGKGAPKIENGVVTQMQFFTDSVTDISPVRALPGLKIFDCSGSSSTSHGKVSDLSPLNGMNLTKLVFYNTRVSDLLPLEGMQLTVLICNWTQVADLSPLRGMPLTYLHCVSTKVSDLSALVSCKTLNTLLVNATSVSPATVAALQKALPNCKIDWDDPAKPKTPKPAAAGSK